MAGHSKFKNIMHRKGAQDKKKAKIFTKIIREITVAVKLGSADPESNPRLRSAIAEAKELNMPKDNIDRAIKKGSGVDQNDNYEDITYEGYAVGGVAIIVEALSDNRNRTASEVRSTFSKNGGNLGADGSVAFMFDKLGIIHFAKDKLGFDALFEASIEAGAQDVVEEENYYVVKTIPEDLHLVNSSISNSLKITSSLANIQWEPKIEIKVEDVDNAKSIIKLIDVLEDLDDVQRVFANFDISDDIIAKLE